MAGAVRAGRRRRGRRPRTSTSIEAGFQAGGTPQEEQRYLFALAEVRDPALFERVLELATSTEVRTQNAPYLLGACIANRDNGAAGLGARPRPLGRAQRAVPVEQHRPHAQRHPGASPTPAVAADVEAFIADHPVPQAKQTVAQHLERMQVTVALRERRAGAG